MENAKEPGTLPLNIVNKTETFQYHVILSNDEVIKITGDDMYCETSESGDTILHYNFYRRKKLVTQLEGGSVKAVLTPDAVEDINIAIKAIKAKKPVAKKKKPV
jgi:hypothetical protein